MTWVVEVSWFDALDTGEEEIRELRGPFRSPEKAAEYVDRLKKALPDVSVGTVIPISLAIKPPTIRDVVAETKRWEKQIQEDHDSAEPDYSYGMHSIDHSDMR